jgi:hypothetical protein
MWGDKRLRPHSDNVASALSEGFEVPVTEHQPNGSTIEGRIDFYKRAAFLFGAKQFQHQPARPTDLHLALETAGAVARKRKPAPVRSTGAWDDAMLRARGKAQRHIRALPPPPNRRLSRLAPAAYH